MPSYIRRNQPGHGVNNPKKRKTIQSWDRDIIYLPQSRMNHAAGTCSFSYPRGQYRAMLGEMGLIGKIIFSSHMNEEDVKQEIHSVFRGPMGNDPNFPFTFFARSWRREKNFSYPFSKYELSLDCTTSGSVRWAKGKYLYTCSSRYALLDRPGYYSKYNYIV